MGISAKQRRLIFLSGTVYTQPLSPTVEKQMRQLADFGEITVVGWVDGFLPLRLRDPVTLVLLPRLPGIGLRYPLFFLAGLVVILLTVRRKAANILVAQSPYEGVVALLGRALARLRRIRPVVVVEAHGDWEEVPRLFRRLWFPRLSARIMGWTASAVLRRTDVVRVISDFTCEKVQKICPQTPLVKFPTFTDLEVFLDTPAPARAVVDFPYILYVGMLVPSKGVEVLIRSFDRVREQHPDVRLILIGRGHAERRFRSLAHALGLSQAICFLPPMTQPELAAWMRAARCLVLPSFSEGLGRVVLEAMACGRPVIGSRVGGIPEMIHEGVNGFLVNIGDVEAVQDRIRRVLDDPQLADQLGRNGRLMAQDLFSSEAYVKGYAEIIEIAERLTVR